MAKEFEERKEFYDNVFGGDDFKKGSKSVKNYLDKYSVESHYDYIAERIKKEKFKSVLEIGVGGGRTLKIIHDKCPDAKLIGMDISPKIIENARKNFERWNMDVELFVGDAYNITDIEDGQFDAVILIDVSEHLEDPVKALKEANRIASHEVIIHVPSRQSIWTFLIPPLRKKIVHMETVVQYWLGHQRLYTYKSLEGEVKGASMRIADYRMVRAVSVNVYPLWRMNRFKGLIIRLYKASIKMDLNPNFNPKFIGNSLLAFCRGN